MTTAKISNIVSMIKLHRVLDLDILVDNLKINNYINYIEYCPTMHGSKVMGNIIRRGNRRKKGGEHHDKETLFRNGIQLQGK